MRRPLTLARCQDIIEQARRLQLLGDPLSVLLAHRLLYSVRDERLWQAHEGIETLRGFDLPDGYNSPFHIVENTNG